MNRKPNRSPDLLFQSLVRRVDSALQNLAKSCRISFSASEREVLRSRLHLAVDASIDALLVDAPLFELSELADPVPVDSGDGRDEHSLELPLDDLDGRDERSRAMGSSPSSRGSSRQDDWEAARAGGQALDDPEGDSARQP
jgi:hypothetical protein